MSKANIFFENPALIPSKTFGVIIVSSGALRLRPSELRSPWLELGRGVPKNKEPEATIFFVDPVLPFIFKSAKVGLSTGSSQPQPLALLAGSCGTQIYKLANACLRRQARINLAWASCK